MPKAFRKATGISPGSRVFLELKDY
ncbi:MAG: AbrB/MazE/SpoVT family DNA-binding domain-containing protein [Candidatus Aenigmarchaeota archaeon]|nr:AbrB/MazE/SpoVT family DNA-binding domain-containing protein [Candidatus Aenigmarchaeota archaeon]